MKKKVYFTKKPKPLLYNRNQIAAYKKALGRSVKIATMYNVNPIPNKTLIFCNVSDCMYKPCTSARAFGQPKQVDCDMVNMQTEWFLIFFQIICWSGSL